MNARNTESQGRIFPLTSLQQGMLFHALLASTEDRGVEVQQMVIELKEQPNARSLADAFDKLLERYPALSASFHVPQAASDSVLAGASCEQGEPFQTFHSGLRVDVADYTLGQTEQVGGAQVGATPTVEDELQALLDQDRRRGFDLSRPPLMRGSVARCAGEKAYFIWTFHHILLDGRCMARFVVELFEVYEAMREQRPVAWGPAPPPFSGYLPRWANRDHTEGVAHFKQLLQGKTGPTPVPLVRTHKGPLGRVREGYGEMQRTCDPQIIAVVRQMAHDTHTTVSSVVQAMFALVLSRYTADADVVFGCARNGRAARGPAAEQVMGLFVNTIPVRADVSDERTVQQLLTSLREQSLRARPFEMTPLSEITRASDMPAGAPLFNAILMFDDRSLHGSLVQMGGPTWADRAVHLYEQPAHPLALTVFDAQEFTLRALYDQSQLTGSAVQLLLDSCEQTLAQLSQDPSARLAALDVLPPALRHRMMVEWNDTARPFSDASCMHELFEARAAQQPDAVAVEVEGTTTTYGALESRANRLAHLLMERGVQPGSYVGICLPRGLDLVTAMLAVLKAGAAYLPIDPKYPAERIAFMLTDVNARLVICDELGHLPPDCPRLAPVEAKDAPQRALPRRMHQGSSTDKCYTIYTSGSTGTPKAVVLTHRAVVNTLEWVNRTFGVTAGDRLLFVTSPCFDLSVYDVFGILSAGATIVIATERQLADPQALATLLVDAKISIWNSAPAALQRLAAYFPRGAGVHLRLTLLSGDWIPLTLPDTVRAAFPSCRVVSLGGATEAAIWSNYFPVGEVDAAWTSIPYGRPIQNAQYYVLDQRMQPAPPLVIGDLYIGGTCLASGYHGRDELTAQRFVRAPFPEARDQVLYKTGDLARYLSDGNLELIGRSDFQVKIRGFRVEMGEVEAALCQLDHVQAAVCIAHPDASGQKSLIAYVVMKVQSAWDEGGIKAHLASRLPAYMVPARVLFLSKLPVTANGKVDRAALAQSPPSRIEPEAAPPQGAVSEELARMWCVLLQRDQVGLDDHFFEIGGHSLLAVMLVARIKQTFGVDLHLAQVLAHPTIRKLSPHIEQATGLRAASEHLQVFHEGGTLPPLVLVPGMMGTAFTYRSLPDSLGPNQPIYVVDLLASGLTTAFPETIEDMADLYEPEIVRACAGQPIVLGGFSFGAIVAFELARRLRRKGHAVPLLISFDGFAPGYPYHLPPPERVLSHMRAFLSRDGAGRIQFLKERGMRLRRRVLARLGLAQDDAGPLLKQELRAHMDRVSAAQRRAGLHYTPEGSEKDLALLLIKAEETPYWSGMKMDDPLHGWRRFVGGPISLITFPGKHLEMWDEDNRMLVTQAIADHLTRFHAAAQRPVLAPAASGSDPWLPQRAARAVRSA